MTLRATSARDVLRNMCGIIGILNKRDVVDRERFNAMRDALAHRGPDDQGSYFSQDGRIALGHRRLAIIDLSAAAAQPMEREGVVLVFNGEIYNFQGVRRELQSVGRTFTSGSDTEVILEAYLHWGIDCVRGLDGMFAFALLDTTEKKLVLARDRAGEKPLFYRVDPRGMRFASELKGLLLDPAEPRTLSMEALTAYLAYGYVPKELCLLDGYAKLLPGHLLTYDLDTGDYSAEPYWTLSEYGEIGHVNDEALLDELEELLKDAVKRQLIADVPVGLMLSGGLDSSLVAAIAAKVSSGDINTFTVGFPGQGEYDERGHARLVAGAIASNHREIELEATAGELLPGLVRQYDEPIGDASILPTFAVCRAIRNEAKVALGGDGGDELFGGYRYYNWLERQAVVRRWLPGWLRDAVSALAARTFPSGFLARNQLLAMSGDMGEAIEHSGQFFDARSRQRLLAANLEHSCTPNRLAPALATRSFPPAEWAMRADFGSYMVDNVLVKVDRASMLTSLEVRAPLLDRRIIDFAFGNVPTQFKVYRGERKILLKRLARRWLPEDFDYSRKQGFSIPPGWYGPDWQRMEAEVLSQSPFFDSKGIRGLLERRGSPLVRLNERLFALLMLELWRREYAISLP